MDREQVNEKYKWKIERIYKNEEEVLKDINLVEEEIKKLVNYKDTKLDGNTLHILLELVMGINRIVDKMETYVSMLCDEDTGVNKNQELKEKVNNVYSKYVKESYFVDTNILKLEYSDIERFYQENEKLLEYQVYLKEMFRHKKYMLSDSEEKLLANMTKAMGNNYETYELLKDSDMKFNDFIVDEKEYKLDNSLYSIYIESNDRNIREKAFKGLYDIYKQFKNVYANLITANVKEEVTLSKIRGYESSLDRSLYKDEVDIAVYNNLVDTVNDNLDVLHKYYRLKKEVLGLDELHLYDVYANMISAREFKYPFDEAKEIVKKALSVLGEDYIKVLDDGINNGWIDVYPNRGKRTGGYSSGSYDTDPYILLNYQDKYDDMSTLAHELGHSMHSYYTRNNNPYHYGYYSILVAEVASTVNELLLAKYVIKNSQDKEEKLFILNRILELYRATIYRQTMFSTFEKRVYEDIENDKPLTADILSDIYYKLNVEYFGDDTVVDEEIRYEWERIPHFYYNFYVYKYATGLSAATYIANGILDGSVKVEDYLAFLKAGRKMSPLESLKLAGVDLTKKEVIMNAIKSMDETIEEFRNLYLDK